MLDNPDDTARLAYLAVLAVAFLFGVFFHYRNRMGRAMRDAAIWVLIILGFVTVYGLKDHLIAGLFPGQAVAISEDTVALRRGDDGHFPADVEVNGVWVKFTVDTGASGIVLSRDDARRVGLDPDGLRFFGTAQTANGRVATAPVMLDEFRLGGIVDRNVRASVNGGEMFGSLLGMDYLDRFRSYTVQGDTLYLTR